MNVAEELRTPNHLILVGEVVATIEIPLSYDAAAALVLR